MEEFNRIIDVPNIWETMQQDARNAIYKTPLLRAYYQKHIVSQSSFKAALASILAEKLSDTPENEPSWCEFILSVLTASETLEQDSLSDVLCQLQHNASIKDHLSPLVYFGGYQALQCYRVAHYCWNNCHTDLANYIQAKIITLFGVDIHPAAVIGKEIFIDHAVGIVIGETAIVEDGVTLFQGVTLGGTGKGSGKRHPTIRKGAFIGAGASILGNIEIGENAKIGSGAVVVETVANNATVIGQKAKIYTKGS